jgi:hypothetical protein
VIARWKSTKNQFARSNEQRDIPSIHFSLASKSRPQLWKTKLRRMIKPQISHKLPDKTVCPSTASTKDVCFQ